MKKTMLIFFTALMAMFLSCESPTSGQSAKSAETTKKSNWWDKFDNWDKGSSAELKIENLVGTWVRKSKKTPPNKIELVVNSDKSIKKKIFENGKLLGIYSGSVDIQNTNEIILHITKLVDYEDISYTLNRKETYQSKLYQKYWECQEKKSGTWKSTEPFYKIK